MRYAMIMAGGAGTRLWPMSRNQRPKQLLPLIRAGQGGGAGSQSTGAPATPVPRGGGPRSLLEISAARLEGVVPVERRFICTAEMFRPQIRGSLPEFTDDRILGEPAARDTVNAVGFAAAVFQKLDKDASFVVLTADHLISPEQTFRERIDLGFRLVEQDKSRLVTFSIKPTYAATGFGYVERGEPLSGVTGPGTTEKGKPLAYRVARFIEKPALHLAQAYVESGDFYWNSGMFVFHAATFMDCLRRFKPESHAGLMEIAAAWGTPKQKAVLEKVYPELPRISVDYAVMEPASRDKAVTICTVLADVNWLDVGSWPAYAETLETDAEGNRVGGAISGATKDGGSGGPGGAGGAVFVDAKDNLVVSDDPGHTVAVLGVKDLVVVHTKDATLVMPREKAEQLKKLHALVDERLK